MSKQTKCWVRKCGQGAEKMRKLVGDESEESAMTSEQIGYAKASQKSRNWKNTKKTIVSPRSTCIGKTESPMSEKWKRCTEECAKGVGKCGSIVLVKGCEW